MSGHDKLAVPHDHPVLHNDGGPQQDTIVVGGAIPGGPGLGGIRTTQGQVDPWKLLILEQVSDQAVQADVRPNGELS